MQKIYLTLAAISLSACVSTGGSPTEMAKAMTAFGGVTQGSREPTKEDLALSCGEINQRLGNIYSRYKALEQEEKKRKRKSALVGGILNTGLTVIGGSAIANAGSIDGIRAASAAVSVGGAALNSVVGAESSSTDLAQINDITILAERSAQLERAKVQKGCAG